MVIPTRSNELGLWPIPWSALNRPSLAGLLIPNGARQVRATLAEALTGSAEPARSEDSGRLSLDFRVNAPL